MDFARNSDSWFESISGFHRLEGAVSSIMGPLYTAAPVLAEEPLAKPRVVASKVRLRFRARFRTKRNAMTLAMIIRTRIASPTPKPVSPPVSRLWALPSAG